MPFFKYYFPFSVSLSETLCDILSIFMDYNGYVAYIYRGVSFELENISTINSLAAMAMTHT
jgi:hypothetical protein